jgi:hypothetical protein
LLSPDDWHLLLYLRFGFREPRTFGGLRAAKALLINRPKSASVSCFRHYRIFAAACASAALLRATRVFFRSCQLSVMRP